jgi:DNA-binding XRE family transcriptional regulator
MSIIGFECREQAAAAFLRAAQAIPKKPPDAEAFAAIDEPPINGHIPLPKRRPPPRQTTYLSHSHVSPLKTAQDRNLIRSPPAQRGILAVVIPMKRVTKKVTPRAATAVDTYIGEQMRNGRIAMGLSQEALGDKLGVSFQQVQKYEKGVNRVSAARLFEICKALKIPLASMFEHDATA